MVTSNDMLLKIIAILIPICYYNYLQDIWLGRMVFLPGVKSTGTPKSHENEERQDGRGGDKYD